ncbi:hypothetical protein [Halobellus rufus]|uniref:hypothetical protein n=1 Tax=Halobellus rufus TaxID=1448860 RepID=UPI0006784BFE|nr:hypothetical protein [Halobellus rufus]
MSNPTVEWTLDQLQSVADAQPEDHPLKRVDRDASNVLEGDITSHKSALKSANYVGAAHVDHDEEAEGPEYNLRIDDIVGVRIEGFSHRRRGHIDPAGVDGVIFDGDPGLVQEIKSALYEARTFPDAGRSSVDYLHLELTNHAPQSHRLTDYFRYDFDILFAEGYEDLP